MNILQKIWKLIAYSIWIFKLDSPKLNFKSMIHKHLDAFYVLSLFLLPRMVKDLFAILFLVYLIIFFYS